MLSFVTRFGGRGLMHERNCRLFRLFSPILHLHCLILAHPVHVEDEVVQVSPVHLLRQQVDVLLRGEALVKLGNEAAAVVMGRGDETGHDPDLVEGALGKLGVIHVLLDLLQGQPGNNLENTATSAIVKTFPYVLFLTSFLYAFIPTSNTLPNPPSPIIWYILNLLGFG